ncbi:sensor histidine kinase [Sphingomonas sp. R86521]|uniref:sensor histidine kinase n=1 Tax=Sphingomonas sp. R86521 TaxID=3093860 RepID=UPI0036D25AC8
MPEVVQQTPSAPSTSDHAGGDLHMGELHNQLALARSGVAQRSLMMAVAGHDLKQPLQIISRALERLAPYAVSNADVMWAEAAGLEIARLAQGLTNLAVAGGRTSDHIDMPELRRFPVADVLDSLHHVWRIAAITKGLDLRVVRCSAMITSDRSLLDTILGNLVGNAIKYTGSGKIVVGCRHSGTRLHLVVADGGCGISDGDRARVFSPFEQIDSDAEGSGLGLYLVRSLCGTLGHELRLESQVGRGSTFIVGVPSG